MVQFNVGQSCQLVPLLPPRFRRLPKKLIAKSPFSKKATISESDVKAYYPNIPTVLGVETIEKWLDLHNHKLPKNFRKKN